MLLQTAWEWNRCAVVQRNGRNVGLIRCQAGGADVENLLLICRIPSESRVGTRRTDGLVHIRNRRGSDLLPIE